MKSELKRLIRLSPETIPFGSEFLKDLDCNSSSLVFMENGMIKDCEVFSCFLVKDIFFLSTLLLIRLLQSTLLMRSRISSAVYPKAYIPPTMEPMLVPAMKSIGIPLSSMYLSTPMCAAPFAPPPDSTSPTLGLLAVSASSWENALSEINDSNTVSIVFVNIFIVFPLFLNGWLVNTMQIYQIMGYKTIFAQLILFFPVAIWRGVVASSP